MAKPILDYEQLKASILTEHNRVRLDPSSYIPLIKNQMSYLKGDILFKPNETPIQTNEGLSAYQEALDFLSKQKPVDPLTHDTRLTQAALDHVSDLGPKGLISHDSSDGRIMSDRIEQHCEWSTCSGENIDLANIQGQDVIISLIVDDGIKDRGHRHNIFREEFKFVGIAVGPHRDFGVMTVIDYAGSLRDKDQPFFDYKNFKYEFPEQLSNSFRKTEPVKKKEKKNPFQLTDEDAPDTTVSVRIVKKEKNYENKKITITKKVYTLQDGTQHIVELEEF